jgi:hypothetical protein
MEYYRLSADREATRRKSIVVLEEAPAKLKVLGLASARSPGGSADQREAVLGLDQEFQDALERVAMIDAVIKLLNGKLKAFEMAYTSVKKILGEGAFDYSSNPNLSGGTGTARAGQQHERPLSLPPIASSNNDLGDFGKSRY